MQHEIDRNPLGIKDFCIILPHAGLSQAQGGVEIDSDGASWATVKKVR
jgi:hypothetical protein